MNYNKIIALILLNNYGDYYYKFYNVLLIEVL